MRNDILRQITGRYITLWGVPQQIHPVPVSESSGTGKIAIMQFAPDNSHRGYVYATNGMSQQDNNPAQRSELFVIVASPQDWVLHMMQALCVYPIQYDTEFVAYDTLQLGDNLKSLGYVALMFIPLSETGYEPSPLVTPPNMPPVFLNQCIGISKSELDLALQYGGRKVWETIAQTQKSILLDVSRFTPDE